MISGAETFSSPIWSSLVAWNQFSLTFNIQRKILRYLSFILKLYFITVYMTTCRSMLWKRMRTNYKYWKSFSLKELYQKKKKIIQLFFSCRQKSETEISRVPVKWSLPRSYLVPLSNQSHQYATLPFPGIVPYNKPKRIKFVENFDQWLLCFCIESSIGSKSVGLSDKH